MKIALTTLPGLALTIALAAHPAYAQAGKKPVPASRPIVLGTKQLPGDFGKIGQTYTIGKSYPLNFTLRSVEYTVAPVSSDSSVLIPQGSEKLMILHYTIQNPLPQEQNFTARSLQFTAVDARDVNHTDASIANRDGTTEDVNIKLKPAQKLDLQGVIVVPAAGGVPKLIVQNGSAPVIRYALNGKVRPLTGIISSPSDTSGATALTTVPAKTGAWVPLGRFDARLDQVTYTTDAINQQTPASGKHYAIAHLTLKNPTAQPQALYSQHWAGELTDTDGEKTVYAYTMLKGTRDELVGSHVAPGEEVKVRIFFALPQIAKGKTLAFAHTAGRIAAFDLETTP